MTKPTLDADAQAALDIESSPLEFRKARRVSNGFLDLCVDEAEFLSPAAKTPIRCGNFVNEDIAGFVQVAELARHHLEYGFDIAGNLGFGS